MQFKPFEELNFCDDYMFKKVMQNEEICKGVIERLLNIKIDHIIFPEIEKEISPYYTTHGVRLDVYVKDSNKIFDIEMQSYKQEALGKRCRYYQSMVDIDTLIKGTNYTDLKESYILFICTEDPFPEHNLPIYTFQNICMQNPAIPLNDNALKVIYNANAYENEKDEKLRAFLKFVHNLNAEDDFTSRISKLINEIKQNEVNKTEYISMNIHDMDIIIAAKKQKAIETAKKLLKMSLSLQQISEATGLSIDEIKSISES